MKSTGICSRRGRFGERKGLSMDIAVLGIDLGKNSCSMVGLDGSGKVILRRRMQRKTTGSNSPNVRSRTLMQFYS